MWTKKSLLIAWFVIWVALSLSSYLLAFTEIPLLSVFAGWLFPTLFAFGIATEIYFKKKKDKAK